MRPDEIETKMAAIKALLNSPNAGEAAAAKAAYDRFTAKYGEREPKARFKTSRNFFADAARAENERAAREAKTSQRTTFRAPLDEFEKVQKWLFDHDVWLDHQDHPYRGKRFCLFTGSTKLMEHLTFDQVVLFAISLGYKREVHP